jgi:hypothetical protein
MVVWITEQIGNSTEGFFAPCPLDGRLPGTRMGEN